MCLEQWQWLAATGKTKKDYKEWLKLQKREDEFEQKCGCWACIIFKNCKKCPLGFCQLYGHPYKLWTLSSIFIYSRKLYAGEMVELIKKSEPKWEKFN